MIHKKTKVTPYIHQMNECRSAESLEGKHFKIIEVGCDKRFLYVPKTTMGPGGLLNLEHVVGASSFEEYIVIHTVASGVNFEYASCMSMVDFLEVMNYWQLFCEGLTDE